MVGTYTPSIAPLEAPVGDCGMGLGGAEASTARRNDNDRGEIQTPGSGAAALFAAVPRPESDVQRGHTACGPVHWRGGASQRAGGHGPVRGGAQRELSQRARAGGRLGASIVVQKLGSKVSHRQPRGPRFIRLVQTGGQRAARS